MHWVLLFVMSPPWVIDSGYGFDQQVQVEIHRPKLYVTTATFNCPPCDRLKQDRKDGKLDKFEFPPCSPTQEYYPPWNGMRSYPAIRFQEPDGSWKVIYGYNEAIRKQLIERLIPPGPPAVEAKPVSPAVAPPAKAVKAVGRNPSLYGQIGTSHESRETLIDHLLNDGIHRRKRTLLQLQAMSDDELNAAHMIDHGSK